MGWVRLDDGFSRHPKVASAGPLGMALQVAALCYCNQYLTDGYIPKAVAPSLLPIYGIYDDNGQEITCMDVVSALINLNIWYEVEGGYQIHDYSDFQPLREEVEKEREAAKARMQEVRSKKKSSSKNVRPNNNRTKKELSENKVRSSPYPVPDPVPVPNDINKQTDNEYILSTSIPEPGPGEKSVSPSVNSDLVLQDVGKYYQQKIGIMSPADEDKLAAWVERGMCPSLLVTAINSAADAGKRRINYVEGILKNWYNDGHRSLQDLVTAEQTREKAKQEQQKGREPPGGGGVPNASAYKPIDPEAVKRWKEMHQGDYD